MIASVKTIAVFVAVLLSTLMIYYSAASLFALTAVFGGSEAGVETGLFPVVGVAVRAEVLLIFVSVVVVVMLVCAFYLWVRSRRIFGVIRLTDLFKHMVILGPTGSGKTTAAKKILRKVRRLAPELPIYIIDYHGEYDEVESVRLGAGVLMNPFDPGDVDIKGYTIFLMNAFKDILQLSEPQTYLLYRALDEEYRSRGYVSRRDVGGEGRSLIPPTVDDILLRLSRMQPISRFDYEITIALERRLLPLTLVNTEAMPSISVSELFSGSKAFDLSELPHEARKLCGLILLHHIYDNPKHCVLVLEESQHFVSPHRPEEPLTIGELMVGELRRHGVAILLIAHVPSQLPSTLLTDAFSVLCLSPRCVPFFVTRDRLERGRRFLFFGDRLKVWSR